MADGRPPEVGPREADGAIAMWQDDGGPEPFRQPAIVEPDALESGVALADILADYRRRHPIALPEDLRTIERAFEHARAAHANQRRQSGEPYFVHPVRVARTLSQLGLDAVSVAAGLLHDAVEDSELTVFDVQEGFGREVATIVDGVTKLGKIPFLSRQEQQAESFRKMLVAMSDDIRVLIVKLADRLDNMRTLDSMSPEKQERISRETMQIYAPLAGRLGIEWLRGELQDLAFSYLEQQSFLAVREDIDAFLRARPQLMGATLERVRGAFAADACSATDDDEAERAGPWASELFGPVTIRATMRPVFRVHAHLSTAGRRVDQLSDIATFQIVTRDRVACYAALGCLHWRFQPVPGRFRDYVALPRPNRYRALHTAIIDRDGQRIEVQIRSEQMDAVAERGIVVQWERQTHPSDRRNLKWLGQLMDWQEDVSDPHEFIEAVKADLFADEVYVFSPQGDIFTFAKSATPIDFAFAIHTDVGMTCSGARVNGHVVPLRYRLRQGDTVEILTNPSVGPREEWLKMCVTSRARARIKHYLRQRERERLRELGRSLVEQEVSARGLDLGDVEREGRIAEQAEAIGLGRDVGEDGVYEAVGAGQLGAAVVAEQLGPSPSADQSLLGRMLRRVTRSGGRSKLEGAGARISAPITVTESMVRGKPGQEAMIQLADCCSPVPGDTLVGFFEPGRGIFAHVEGCPEALESVSERRVPLRWQDGLALSCPVTLEVRTANTVGLLAQVSRVFSDHGVNIRQANCRTYGDGGRAINTFHATVDSHEQLRALMGALKRIEGVVAVERVFSAIASPGAT